MKYIDQYGEEKEETRAEVDARVLNTPVCACGKCPACEWKKYHERSA